ncbi:DNA topoisomerase, partial [Treponema sp. R6D11]
STYAPTIATIIARGYVSRSGKTLSPNELGILVTEVMEEYFQKILDVGFTASMEDELDKVAEENKNWKEILRDFYPDFKTALTKAEDELSKIEIKDEVSDVVCDKCGKMMVYKLGRYG